MTLKELEDYLKDLREYADATDDMPVIFEWERDRIDDNIAIKVECARVFSYNCTVVLLSGETEHRL